MRRIASITLGLLGTDGIGIERVWRLHRHHREQLEHMVRHHVPQRAGLVVEFAAALDADRLGGGDLHMIDMVTVPNRLEHEVGEPQDHDVLHRLLAEEVVDAEDLVLVDDPEDLLVELACAEFRSVPNGFSMMMRRN